MSLKIPDSLTADMPKTVWGKMLAATPVVMTVVATLLAGLSSSEMTRAQYARSLAAQLQSKAGDQWGYFQAKRLRATGLRTSADLMQATVDVGLFDPAGLPALPPGISRDLTRADEAVQLLREALAVPGACIPAVADALDRQLDAFQRDAARRRADLEKLAGELTALLAAPDTASAFSSLVEGAPAAEPDPLSDPALATALEAVISGRAEAEIPALLAAVSDSSLAAALETARERVRAYDTKVAPVNRLCDRLDSILGRMLALAQDPQTVLRCGATIATDTEPRLRLAADAAATAAAALRSEATRLYRGFSYARFRYTAGRYDAEARLNQGIANLYELQVRKGNLTAQRHHTRSMRFFYGMLAAQAAVIIATFAIAARQRNLLWGLAAAAGTAAVLFAIYVYLYV